MLPDGIINLLSGVALDLCGSWMYHLSGPLQNVLSWCDWAKYAHLKPMSCAGALPKVIAQLLQRFCNRKRPFLLLHFSHLKTHLKKKHHLVLHLFMGFGYYDSDGAVEDTHIWLRDD